MANNMFKIELPKNKIHLPILDKDVYVYQYNRLQEKKLLLASGSEDIDFAFKTIMEVIKECFVPNQGINVEDLHPLDYEFLLVQLKIISDTNIIPIIYSIDECSTEECDTDINGMIDLTAVTFPKIPESLSETFDIVNGKYVYNVSDNLKLIFNQLSIKDIGSSLPLYSMLNSICYGDEVKYKEDDFKNSDFEELIDSLPAHMAADLESVITEQPSSEYKILAKCKTCKRVHSKTLTGIASFFF